MILGYFDKIAQCDGQKGRQTDASATAKTGHLHSYADVL